MPTSSSLTRSVRRWRLGTVSETAKQQGPRLLKNSTVAAAIEVAQAERAERLQITADDVLREAWAIATNADEPASARVSALALCAKHTGGFADRTEHAGPGGRPVPFAVAVANLSDEELRHNIAVLARQQELDEAARNGPGS